MVTAIGNMEMQAYRELHCYQYIMKPFHREQVEEVVQKVLEKESREKPPVIVVKKDGINYQLKCEDIRYLEAIPRGTRLHLVTENWDVPYVTLRQMLLKMPKGMFAQCHRSFIVNLVYIRNISNGDITMANGSVVQMSRNYQSQLIKQFRQYYLGGTSEC